MARIRATFLMSFIEGLLNTWILGPQLHILVIMKGLRSDYNIDSSCIDKARNAKVLCLFENPAYLDLLFFVQYAFFSITVHRPWRPPAPPAASWCLIGSTSSSKYSYWSPLATAEGLVSLVQGVVFKIAAVWGNMDGRYFYDDVH